MDSASEASSSTVSAFSSSLSGDWSELRNRANEAVMSGTPSEVSETATVIHNVEPIQSGGGSEWIFVGTRLLADDYEFHIFLGQSCLKIEATHLRSLRKFSRFLLRSRICALCDPEIFLFTPRNLSRFLSSQEMCKIVVVCATPESLELQFEISNPAFDVPIIFTERLAAILVSDISLLTQQFDRDLRILREDTDAKIARAQAQAQSQILAVVKCISSIDLHANNPVQGLMNMGRRLEVLAAIGTNESVVLRFCTGEDVSCLASLYEAGLLTTRTLRFELISKDMLPRLEEMMKKMLFHKVSCGADPNAITVSVEFQKVL
eukprot:ANDGO_07239.mRNA.1 hypothetical protein